MKIRKLEDLSDKKADLGGDDLLQSLVEAGAYNGDFYGVPYYAGARIVVYRKDLLEAAGIPVPTTLDEFVQAGIKLKQGNASTPNFSGIYFPGKYWYAALPFIWENDPDLVVVGGGVAEIGQPLHDALVTALEARAATVPFMRALKLSERVRLVPPDRPVGAIGAALAAVAAWGTSA